MKIAGYLVLNEQGVEIKADAFGCNVAFSCYECGHPILATALEDQRGSDERHPSACKGCGKSYFLDVRENTQKLYVHKVWQNV